MFTGVDGDIIPYEVGSASEPNGRPLKWKTVKDNVDKLVDRILDRTGATTFEIFLSEKGNYRPDIATIKPYKGQRPPEKPYWFHKIREYLYEHWGATAVNGCEADDALGIRQHFNIMTHQKSCIASRDKDLRIIPGWHYSWACGDSQPEKPLYIVPVLGELWPKWKEGKRGPLIDDLKGCGLKFFYAQMIMGDSADNIPGAPKKGATAAYEAINDCKTEQQMYDAVTEIYLDAYKKQISDGTITYKAHTGEQKIVTLDDIIRENGLLLWMQAYEGDMWDRGDYRARYSL